MKTMRTTNSGLLIGAILLLIGFGTLVQWESAWSALFVCGLIAWAVAFKKDSLQVLSFPKKIWMIPLSVILYFVVGLLIGVLSGMQEWNGRLTRHPVIWDKSFLSCRSC